MLAFLALVLAVIIPLPSPADSGSAWYDISISGWALVLIVVGMLFPRTRTAISEIFAHVGNGAVSVGTAAMKAVGLVHSKTPPPTTPPHVS